MEYTKFYCSNLTNLIQNFLQIFENFKLDEKQIKEIRKSWQKLFRKLIERNINSSIITFFDAFSVNGNLALDSDILYIRIKI
ncbi:hypothetical protein BpHYR1_051481 [Brachionus plicatilis]|uniref:Uncharacterized protein n=1 Tax=Brachionus plicatilis TaxID=10195 RepID=A0A3M7S2Y7_BRAPC|nr:hypothetical protein BpHYR1_051481 [Brachionus plicatilis]